MDKRRDIQQAADEIEELFADLWQVVPFTRGLRHGYRPQVDCYRTDDPPALIVLAELPGIDPEQVRLVVTPQGLLVAGERERPKDCGHYQQMEIDYGPFQRQIALTEDVDADAATATYERGVLRVTLPIAPKPAGRESVSIEVKMSR